MKKGLKLGLGLGLGLGQFGVGTTDLMKKGLKLSDRFSAASWRMLLAPLT